MDVTIFGIHLNLNPVAFTLPFGGGWQVYWYGIIIAVGFLLAVIYGIRRAYILGIDSDRLIDCILVTTPLAILSARTYYLLFDGEGLSSFKHFFTLGEGFSGLAIYGGVIGAVVFGMTMCKIRKLSLISTLDLMAPCFLIGQCIGRWGNFMNQEAFGSATGSDWFGMTSSNVVNELGEGQLAHPCFLYESVWCLIGFLIINYFFKRRKFSGQLALTYGVWYGFGRMIIEGFRTDSLYIFGLIRVSQILSGVLFVASLVALIVIFRKKFDVTEKVFETLSPDSSTLGITADDAEDEIYYAESDDEAETEKNKDETVSEKECSLKPEKIIPPDILGITVDPRGLQSFKEKIHYIMSKNILPEKPKKAEENGEK